MAMQSFLQFAFYMEFKQKDKFIAELTDKLPCIPSCLTISAFVIWYC